MPQTLSKLTPETGSVRSMSKSESEEVPTISAMDAWDDFRMELELSEGLGPTIAMMQNNIDRVKNKIDKKELLMLLQAMETPGSMEYNGVMRKIEKSDKQDIAKNFLRIYKRIIEQRINELDSR